MKAYLSCIGLILTALLLGGCGANNDQARQQSISTVPAPFASAAINLKLIAEPGLNSVNDLPNSCTVLLIQAKDKSALDKLLNNTVLLKGLFAGGGSEGDILQLDRYVMMPGQTNVLHIDRAQYTRVIALVAGFYPFPVKQHMITAAIPINTLSSGWWSPVWQSQLVPITLSITLGTKNISIGDKSNISENVGHNMASANSYGPAAIEDRN